MSGILKAWLVGARPHTLSAAVVPVLVGTALAHGRPGFEWGVFALYVIVVAVLGVALVYALSMGTNYTTFAGSVVTALTTIAGFGVGVNSTTPSPPTTTPKK